MKSLLLPITVLVSTLFVVTGCGQKGPLYLPEKQAQPIVTKDMNQTNKEDAKQIEEKTDTQKDSQ